MSDINALLENAGVCGFHPVQCTQKTLDSIPSSEGYLYFTTDTKKIYLGKSNGKIDMCATTGIFYGTKDIKYVNNGLTPDPNVSFTMNEIEGDDWPEIKDLILNKDGCFYRVKSINAESGQIFTERLTLQGTGGGSNSGGGSSDGGSYNIGFSNISKSYTFSSVAKEMLVGVVGWRSNTTDNYISSITFTIGDSKEPFKTEFGPLEFNKIHYINLASYKHLLQGINNTVRVKISDKFGESREDDINIKLVTISLEKTKPTLLPALTSDLPFSCKLSGGTGSDVSNKKIVYTFYREENPTQNVLTLEQKLNVNDVDNIPSSLDLSALDHGIYILTVQAFVDIAGTIDPVPSNILTHKIGYVVDETASLLLTLPPETTEQYTDIEVKYLYITNSSTETYTVELKVNNVHYKNIIIYPNVEKSYSFYFEDAGTKRIQFIVLETGITSTFDITLTPYTGNLPLIDATRADLMLYLNPKGKTNNDTDKNIWVDAKGGQLTAYLNGVSYSEMDGWCVDEETGDTYLKLISGATLTMPDFKPFTVDHMGNDGMTIELDFEVDGITDMSAQIMSCISYTAANKPAVGFELVGNEFKMYSRDKNGITLDEKTKSALVSQTIVEGKRVKLSIVIDSKTGDNTNGFPMCYTYLNGKISEAVKFDASDAFLDSTRPATLIISSQEAQIKIYSIRFYNSRLGESLILNNYTATLPTLEERQKVYNSNAVYDGTKIDFKKVSDKDYDLEIPYMMLTGGYKCSANDKWALDTVADVGLPTGKKDYRLVDIKVVYPKYVAAVKDENGNIIIPAKNEYFAGYADQEFINIFSNGLGMAENLGKRPSNGGAIMYCQGTSSMEYPVKNLRLRWKNDDDYFTVRPNLPDVEIVCMKADYMESSGSHNTGAANLIDKLYAGASMKTPGQAKNWNGEQWISGKETVTCIKGHPCLIFYSETGAPDSYEYIGKYNLNLDKATPEPFGFYHDEEDNFGYLKDEEGNVVLDEDGNKQNSIFCYEFLDNAAYPVCNFLVTSLEDKDGNVPTNYHDTWYKTFWHAKDKKYYPGWRMGFESRYPEDDESTHGADAFYPLANWINDLYHLRSGLGIYENAANETAALDRFKNEYWKYLDKDFTLAYYLITEALLMADSRVKNMMIATWGKEWRYRLADGSITTTKPTKGIAVEGTPTGNDYNEHFGYIFYPIFYDMDTMLGVNNEGKMTFEYYTEDTEEGVYNGANVLWHLVRDSLPTELVIAYSELEKAGLHAPLILPYFNQNQANMANEAFYNGDADYKYIIPARYGYEDLLNGTTIAPGAAPYLYALQGDRALHRESFINNRMQFLRGKYISDKFLEGDQVAFRWYTPTYNENDNSKESISAKAVPPLDSEGKSVFHFTGLKYGFAGVQLGKNGFVHANKFTPGLEHDFVLNAANADGTEAYLLGLSALSDVGDLSNKYMSKFVISSPDNRLERVTLGNPNKFYYNANWSKGSDDIIIDSPYLEYFNLQNCSTYAKVIDLRQNPVIKEVLMTGSGVTTLHLPENGVLTKLKLPNTLSALKIIGHKTLLDSEFEMGTYKYGSDGVEIDKDFDYQASYNLIDGEGGSYIDDFSSLIDLHLENTNIDTYRVLKGARFLEKYYLHGINWQMNEVDPDQYCKRNSDWVYDYDEENNPITLKDAVPAGVYYIYNTDNGEYEFYMGTQYPENNVLYERVSMLDSDNNIVCIPMLEKLLTLNSRASDPIHSESLSGTINISIPGVKVIELDIYDKYKNHYPNINIEYDDTKVDIEKAHIINFYPGAIDRDYVENIGSIEGLNPSVTARTAQNAKTLAELIGDYVPIKVQTISNTFTFTGEWIDWADVNKTSYYQNNVPSGKEAFAFATFKPIADMDLIPVFTTHIRYYNVTLYDYDNTVLVQKSLPYNVSIYNGLLNAGIAEGNLSYVYRDDSDIDDVENYRWMFQGWINERDHLNNVENPDYYNLSTINIASDFKAYAYYKLENVHEVATANKYFDFASVSINDTLLGSETYSGYSISIKDIYRNIIQGKLTLPDKYNNTNIIEIGDFTEMTGITHVYFKNKDTCNYIQTKAQKGFGLFGLENMYLNSNLKVVDLPPSFRLLNHCAFQGCNNLTTINLHNNILRIGNYALGLNTSQYGNGSLRMITNINALPTGLLELGEYAFLGNVTNLVINSLPRGLKKIPQYCFCWCSNVAVDQIGGDIGSSVLTAINSHAFYGAGSGVVTLTIGPSVAIIGNNAFANGFKQLKTLNLGRKDNSYIDENGNSSSLLNMGFAEDLTVSDPD